MQDSPAALRPRTREKRIPFVKAAYAMVDSPTYEMGVGWTSDGLGIEVRDLSYFCEHVLPKFFQHSNLSSFVRQLNMYGFEKHKGVKHAGVAHTFVNPNFFRGGQDRLDVIERKTSWRSAHKLDEDHREAILAVSEVDVLADEHKDFIQRLDEIESRNDLLKEQNTKLRAVMDKLSVVQVDIQNQMKNILQTISQTLDVESETTGVTVVPNGPGLSEASAHSAILKGPTKRIKQESFSLKTQVEECLRKIESYNYPLGGFDLVRSDSLGDSLIRLNSHVSTVLSAQDRLSPLVFFEEVLQTSKHSLTYGYSTETDEYNELTQSLSELVDKTQEVFRRVDTLSDFF